MRIFIKLVSFVYAVLMIYLIAALLITYAPRLAGVIPLEVQTNSLSDKYPAGSLSYVKVTELEDFAEGDVVVFTDESLNEVFYEVKSTDLVGRTLTVKGTGADSLTTKIAAYDSVVGKAVFKIPYIGGLFSITAQKDMNLPVLIEIIAAIVILSVIVGRIKRIAYDNIN